MTPYVRQLLKGEAFWRSGRLLRDAPLFSTDPRVSRAEPNAAFSVDMAEEGDDFNPSRRSPSRWCWTIGRWFSRWIPMEPPEKSGPWKSLPKTNHKMTFSHLKMVWFWQVRNLLRPHGVYWKGAFAVSFRECRCLGDLWGMKYYPVMRGWLK